MIAADFTVDNVRLMDQTMRVARNQARIMGYPVTVRYYDDSSDGYILRTILSDGTHHEVADD